ncbi:MAG: prolyl oligopeptidase family serine peptidase [Opitutus sp.]
MPDPAHATETQTVHHFERTTTVTLGYKYLMALPEDYGSDAGKRWPLLLFLHGSGERGDDIWLVAKHGPPKLLRESQAGPAARMLAEHFIVVSPQCPKGVWWDTDTLLALLDEIIAKHRVDPARVYLTGLSMGGYGAWELGTAHPERFAAMVPICGGGNFLTAYGSSIAKREALRSLGIWAFHGAKDETVPLEESERMVAVMKRFEVADVRLTIHPEAKHDSWTETYANPDLYDWMLGHVRR